MRIAIAVTAESIVSVVASAWELIGFCIRSQEAAAGEAAQLFAVSSEPGQAFQRRFGFIEFLDSRLTVPVDWVFVPALEVAHPWSPAPYKPLINWLRRAHRQGALISSVGTGSFLLAEAGLLDGRAAVTHSIYADQFAERYPDIELQRGERWVHEDNMLISGDTPWQELALAVIAGHWGEQTAQLAADTYALHWEHAIDLGAARAQPLDPGVARAKRWMLSHLREHDLLGRCCEQLSLSRRTFNRRFKLATGTTPLEFLQQARLQASQNLLMFTDRSVEEISSDVGYDDIGALYKLYRRHAGISPSRFRRQFAAGVR